MIRHAVIFLLLVISLSSACHAAERVIFSFAESTAAPRSESLMFCDGHGKVGHDRIHLATPKNRKDWEQAGIAFSPDPRSNIEVDRG